MSASDHATGKTTVKRDGKFYLNLTATLSEPDFDEAVWDQFNEEVKALIEKTKEESPAEQQ